MLSIHESLCILCFVSICALLCYLRIQYGPGIDTDSSRCSIKASKTELDFLNEHVTSAGEITGVMERIRPHQHIINIFYRIWIPKHLDSAEDVIAIVIILHGMNSHSARNGPFCRELLRDGFMVAGMDLEGLGRSGGCHGYFASVADLVDDTIAFIQEIRNRFRNKKIFLKGSSLGGLIALSVMAKMDHDLIDGAIILCPAIKIHASSRPHYIVEKIGLILLRFCPKLPIASAHQGRSAPAAVAAQVLALQKADPLFYNGKLRIGTGLAILKAIEDIQLRLRDIKCPYLLQHGTSDRVCHISGSEWLHAQTSSKDKTFIQYPGAVHDLCNEDVIIKDAVIRDFIAWIQRRTP